MKEALLPLHVKYDQKNFPLCYQGTEKKRLIKRFFPVLLQFSYSPSDNLGIPTGNIKKF